MIQGKLIEGRMYYVMIFDEWRTGYYDNTFKCFHMDFGLDKEVDKATDWLLIPAAEEIIGCRKGECYKLAEMQSDDEDAKGERG